MKNKSSLAVIMATHNDNEELTKCVESLNASSIPCDIYIVDDASKTPASEFLKECKNVDLTRLDKNVGPAKARNIALLKVFKKSYDFIAVMDADDTCDKYRLEKQVEFLEKNPKISIVGTWARAVSDKTGKTLFEIKHPTSHNDICKALCYNSAFVHPTTMFRFSTMKELGGYDENFPVAQDYEIFARASQTYKLANIPEVLLNYTWSSRNITATKRKQQLLARLRIQLKYFKIKNPHCWIGIMKTILIPLLPMNFLTKIKQMKPKSKLA